MQYFKITAQNNLIQLIKKTQIISPESHLYRKGTSLQSLALNREFLFFENNLLKYYRVKADNQSNSFYKFCMTNTYSNSGRAQGISKITAYVLRIITNVNLKENSLNIINLITDFVFRWTNLSNLKDRL